MSCGVCFSSLLGNTQRGVVLLNAGLFMVLILWKQELYTGYKTPRVLQVSMTICYIFAVYMTVIALRTQIPNLINSFIGG